MPPPYPRSRVDRERDTSAANTSHSSAVVPSLITRSAYDMVQEASSATQSAAYKTSAGSSSSCGVSALRWSHDGRFIASTVMESSRVLWVWDMLSLVCVAQLQNLAPFLDFQWCSRTNQLAAACGSRTVYVWTEDGE
jgi:WD40 repeat protein